MKQWDRGTVRRTILCTTAAGNCDFFFFWGGGDYVWGGGGGGGGYVECVIFQKPIVKKPEIPIAKHIFYKHFYHSAEVKNEMNPLYER